MTMADVTIQLIYLLRIVLAAVCGAAIGYERESRFKTAGIRTHVIVSLASAMMMIISKYGFYDVVTHDSINLDPSRVAAGVVSAIGFLGAGIIFVHNQTVSGLTTAAGIWATVGVGMAFGGGMYIVGGFTTVLMILLQILLHRNFRFIKSAGVEQLTLKLKEGSNFDSLADKLKDRKIDIVSAKIKRSEDGILTVKLSVKFPDAYRISDIISMVETMPEIASADF